MDKDILVLNWSESLHDSINGCWTSEIISSVCLEGYPHPRELSSSMRILRDFEISVQLASSRWTRGGLVMSS